MDTEELTRVLSQMSDMAQEAMPEIEKLAEYASENEIPGLEPLLNDVMTLMVWIRSSVVGSTNDSR
jgi:hypothetical protein